MAGIAPLARRFSRKRARPGGIEKIETQNCGGIERNGSASGCTTVKRSDTIRSLCQDGAYREWLRREHAGGCRLLSPISRYRNRVSSHALSDRGRELELGNGKSFRNFRGPA